VHTNIGKFPAAATPHLESKKNLIELTKRSLRDEARIVQVDKDYSYASTSWLPVKVYYLLFNEMLTIDYLFTLDPQSFKLGHGKCSESFTRKLAAGEMHFSEPELNAVYDKMIFSHHEAPGANLRPALTADQHTTLAMKKIALYKLEEWKRLRKISSFVTEESRKMRDAYLQRFQLSIFEFPYQMRLRANYRDFAFIDSVSSTDTANYFNDYLAFARYFYRALRGLKDQLVRARTR